MLFRSPFPRIRSLQGSDRFGWRCSIRRNSSTAAPRGVSPLACDTKRNRNLVISTSIIASDICIGNMTPSERRGTLLLLFPDFSGTSKDATTGVRTECNSNTPHTAAGLWVYQSLRLNHLCSSASLCMYHPRMKGERGYVKSQGHGTPQYSKVCPGSFHQTDYEHRPCGSSDHD